MSDRRKWIVLLVFTMMFLAIGCSYHKPDHTTAVTKEQLSKLEAFSQAADDLYKQTNAGNVTAARVKLAELGNMLPGMSFQGITSVEGVQALTQTIVEAKRVFNAVKISPDATLIVSAKLRLAADALTHKNEPMWLQYYKVLQDDLNSISQAAEKKDSSSLAGSISLFEQHYQMIRPSLLISRDPSEAEKADSFLTFLKSKGEGKDIRYEELAAGTKRFAEELERLFGTRKDEQTAYLPMGSGGNTVAGTLALGLFIIMVLIFAAWRMFPAKSGIVPVRRNDRWKW